MTDAATSRTENVGQLEVLRRHAEAYKSLKTLFDRALVGIFILEGGKFQFANSAFETIVGYYEKELLGRESLSLVHPEDRQMAHEHAVATLKGERAAHYQYRVIHRGGDIKWVLETVAQIEYMGKKAVLGYCMEVTDTKLAEEELAKARQEQLLLKDQFLSRVSHELRTPLATIHQFVTILLDGLAGELTPPQREYLETALRSTKQLHAMVNDLLEVTRAQTGKLIINPRRFSLTELVAETVHVFQMTSARSISIPGGLPSDLPPVYGDPDRVRQILVNLINNAMQFTPNDGSVTVGVGTSKEDPGYLCVSIADTGCGIPSNEKENIFQYLYQVENGVENSRRGLGLGLHICKELVCKHGGRIWVESELGHGSTFFFTLPICSGSSLHSVT